jgi:clumping factor A
VSIVATLLAVIVLIGSARRTAAARLAAGAGGSERDGSERDGSERDGSERAGTERPSARRSRPVREPAQSKPAQSKPVPTGRTEPGEDVYVHSGVIGTIIEGSLVEEAPDPVPTPGDRVTTQDRAAGSRETPIPTQARPTIDLDLRPDDGVPDVLGADDEGEIEGYVEGEFTEDDPPGEPPPQLVSPADAKLVARLDAEVLVVDGRPRYHRAACGFLRGHETESLPVRQAVELGFTPCGRCEPDSALVAAARSN